jgi:hypothetical protein
VSSIPWSFDNAFALDLVPAMHRPWYEVSKYDVCGPMICISAPIQTSAVIDAVVVDADPRRAKPTSCRVLDIVIDDGLSDIVAGRFDAGIRIGERLEKDMIAVRLTPDIKMIAVASPQYLAHHGEPRAFRSSNSTPSTQRGTGIAARLTGKRAGIGTSGPTTRPRSSKAQNVPRLPQFRND